MSKIFVSFRWLLEWVGMTSLFFGLGWFWGNVVLGWGWPWWLWLASSVFLGAGALVELQDMRVESQEAGWGAEAGDQGVKKRGLIRRHLRHLWRGRYQTGWAATYLLLGIFALPTFLLILAMAVGAVVLALTGWKPPGELIGEALWLPVLAYLLVAMVGTWASATRQQAEITVAGIKRPVIPLLAKGLVLLCATGWVVVGFALLWLRLLG